MIRYNKIGIKSILLPLFLATTACTNIQNPMSVLNSGSSVDDIHGKLIDTIELNKIDYSSQSKARTALLGQKDAKTPYPAESYIGVIDHSRIVAPQTVIYDRQVNDFIQKIITRLLANWKGTKPDIRVAFVVDSSQAQFIAESGSDGTMYFGLSAIRDVDSTDELVFTTAHELAHILLNHTARVNDQQQIEKAGQTAAVLALLGNGLANSGTGAPSVGAINTNSNIGYAIVGLEVLLNDVLSPAFSRQQEREADILAADLMIQAGYSPVGVDQIMQRFRDIDRKTAEAKKLLRQQQAAAREEQEKKQAAAQGKTLLFSSASLTQGIFGGLEDAFSKVSADHPPAASRDSDLNLYMKREYAAVLRDKSRRELKTAEYQQFKISVAGGPLMRRQFALSADILLKAGKYDEAYTMALHALGDPKDPAAEPRMDLYRIRKAQADRTGSKKYLAEAVKHLEIAWAGPEAYPELGVILANEYTAAMKYDAADSLLNDIGTRFGDPVGFLPFRIANWVAANRKDSAFARTYECLHAAGSHADIAARCSAILPEPWRDDYAAYAASRQQEEAAKHL